MKPTEFELHLVELESNLFLWDKFVCESLRSFEEENSLEEIASGN